MFSQTVEYALRAIVHLAVHAPQPQTTSEIAAATQVPTAYLSKVLQALRVKELVNLRRGIGGGVTLTRPTTEITILDVVNAVDPFQRITTCPLKLEAHGIQLCALHRRMDDALQRMESALRDSTVAELLADPNPSIPLCSQAETS
jgi:Rrf2 family nitric oxide-sensitive transcriptional repressor